MMMGRRIEFQRSLDHGRRPCPLPERKQRFGGVPREHGAERALQTKLTGHFDTAQCLACRVLVPADVVERVGMVDVEAQQRTWAGASGVTNPLECREPLVLSTGCSQTGAQRDPGVRRDRVRAGQCCDFDGLLRELDASLRVAREHGAPRQHLQYPGP